MPVPTVIEMEPPLPLVAVPVPMRNSPLLADEVVPLLNVKCPLTPAVPALVVFTTMLPLDVAVP